MATALEKFTNLATGNVKQEDVFGTPGVIKLPETLTNIPEVPIEKDSNLNLQDETEKQVKIAGFQEDQVDDVLPAVSGTNAGLKAFVDAQPEVDTAPITERSGLTDTLASELETLTGKSSRLLEERDEELGTQEKQLADLNVEIASLTAEFDTLTSAQEGRGRTKIFTSGRQAQIQRQKAIVIGGKATLALALQGNIEASRAKAQETVDLEFGALEQNIANTRELLELNEPEYNATQKKEAAKLLAQLNERTRLLENAKAEKNSIFELAISVAENGGDQSTINSILNSGSIDEAIGLSGTLLDKTKDPLDKQLSVTEAQKLGVAVGSTFRDVLGIIPPKDASQSGFDFKTQSAIENIAKQFDSNQIVKDFVDVQNKKVTVDQIVNGKFGGPGDLALVFEFMKALDPTSVVRESEFATAAKSGTIFKGIFARFNGQFKEGEFLDEGVRDAFNRLTDVKFQAKKGQLENLRNQFGQRIDRRTGQDDGQDFLTQYQFDLTTDEDRVRSLFEKDPAQVESVIQSLESRGIEPSDENILEILSFNQAGTSVSPTGNIQPVQIGGKTIKVDDSIQDRLTQADQAFFEATGKHLSINQSFRTREQQQAIFNRLSKSGGRVAPPGSSFHEKGLAIDVTNWQEAEPFLRRFGFLNNLADDKGHFSVGEFT